ncbi:MAG: glycosyltransferase family 2 protein [bacterium]
MKLLSVIIPIYNEEGNIDALYKRLTASIHKAAETYELIFVNDGSKDNSLPLLKALVEKDKTHVKVIGFSRNFGHQNAVSAGLDCCSGDAAVIIDADLQDPPEIIPELITKWKEGYDVVYAIREQRKGESLFKKFTAWFFYRFLRKITKINIPVDTGDFRLIDRKVIDTLTSMPERNRFLRGLVSWVGFKQTGVSYQRDARHTGTTNYPLKKMVRFALNGITSFSYLPLQLATYLGFFVSVTAFLVILFFLFLRLFTEISVPGFTSLMITVLFLGGIQLITLGIMGEYIGRIYDEVKQRPLYIVSERFGFDKKTQK